MNGNEIFSKKKKKGEEGKNEDNEGRGKRAGKERMMEGWVEMLHKLS